MKIYYKCPHCGSIITEKEFKRRMKTGDPYAEFCMCEYLEPPNYERILHKYERVIEK